MTGQKEKIKQKWAAPKILISGFAQVLILGKASKDYY